MFLEAQPCPFSLCNDFLSTSFPRSNLSHSGEVVGIWVRVVFGYQGSKDSHLVHLRKILTIHVSSFSLCRPWLPPTSWTSHGFSESGIQERLGRTVLTQNFVGSCSDMVARAETAMGWCFQGLARQLALSIHVVWEPLHVVSCME